MHDLLGLARVGSKHGSHVLAGIVGLEPGRLHNEDGVSRRVRLVESIGGKLKNVVPDLLGDLLLVAVGHRAVHPVVVRGLFLAVGPVEHRGGQKLDLLLCHGLTDARVRFAGREAAHLHRDLHNLFLVDHGAIRLAKDVVEARVVRDGLLLAVHTVDVGVHHAGAQRSGAIQGDKSDDVLVLARLHVLDGGRHAARLDLEDAGRVARTHELEDLGVVERNLGLVDVDAAGGLDVLFGLGDNGERTQAQEVHLEQAHVGDHVAFVLGDFHAALCVELRGHMLVDRVSADENGAGVHALAAREALDGQRRVDNLLCVGVFLVGLHKVGREIVLVLLVFAHGRGKRRVGGVGNHLGKLLGEAHREAQHARGIVDGLFGLEDRVRDNVRDVVGAVAAADIVHHLQAPLIVEVHIDIGHLGTLGRQESLEHQAVLKRVEARDVHGVRNDGACGRTTARTHADTVCLGPLHVVGDDEEVGGKTLVADDLVFVLETLHNIGTRGLPIGSVVARQARLAVAAELALVSLPLVKTRVARKDDLVEVQVDARFFVEHLTGLGAALLSDLNRVVTGLLVQGAQGRTHLLFGLHVELVVLEAHAVGVVEFLAHADAHHGVLRDGIFAQQIMEVVRGDRLDAEFAGKLVKVPVELVLRHAGVGAHALILQLDIEIPGRKDRAERLGPLHCLSVVAPIDALRNDAGDACRGGDEAVGVVAQHVERHAGLVIETARGRLRHHVHEVDVARIVLGEQNHVVQLGLAVTRERGVRREVDLATQDGLDAVLGALASVGTAGYLGIKVILRATIHVAMVGDGTRRHAKLPCALGHVLETRDSVEQ